jgi:hypothetical protein
MMLYIPNHLFRPRSTHKWLVAYCFNGPRNAYYVASLAGGGRVEGLGADVVPQLSEEKIVTTFFCPTESSLPDAYVSKDTGVLQLDYQAEWNQRTYVGKKPDGVGCPPALLYVDDKKVAITEMSGGMDHAKSLSNLTAEKKWARKGKLGIEGGKTFGLGAVSCGITWDDDYPLFDCLGFGPDP